MADPILDVFERAPGVFITESASPPPPPAGIPKSTGAIFGVTETGPVGEAVVVRSFAEWQRIFGEFISDAFPAWKHVKKAFQNGTTRLVFVRVVHYTDVTDNESRTSAKATTTILDNSGVVAASATGTSTGDDGAGASGGTYGGRADAIYTIAVSTAGAFDGVVGELSITSDNPNDAGPFLVKPTSTVAFNVGTLGVTLALTDGGDGVLTAGDDWTIGVTASVASRIDVESKYDGDVYNDFEIRPEVSSLGVAGEFKITVVDSANLPIETVWDNLSLDTEAANYFVTIVNNDFTGSDIIRLVDTANVNPVILPQENAPFANGDAGLVGLVKEDYIGDPTGETGVEGFNQIEDNLVIGSPDHDDTSDSAAVTRAIDVFIQVRHNKSFQVKSSKKGQVPEQVKTFQLTTLALDSPFYALYYPWILDSDDDNALSPTGAVIGLYARFADLPQFGIHFSPAGNAATLNGVSGIERVVGTVNAGILNENRINLIKAKEGIGVVVFGARTGAITRAADFKFIGERLNTSFIERFVEINTEFAVLRPNDTVLYQQITAIVSDFLRNHWLTGALDGASQSAAFRVICNNEVNTDTTRQAGLVVAKIGIRNKRTAEFIWFNVTQLASGGSTIEEAA